MGWYAREARKTGHFTQPQRQTDECSKPKDDERLRRNGPGKKRGEQLEHAEHEPEHQAEYRTANKAAAPVTGIILKDRRLLIGWHS